VTEDNNPADHELNLSYSIDDEKIIHQELLVFSIENKHDVQE
jgi:hypothetical protein